MRVVVLLGLAMLGCAPRARVASAVPPAASCGPEVRGASAALRPGVLLILGELHGTREVPQLVGRLVCQAVGLGAPVRLGLELPAAEQHRLDGYLASNGGPAARETLLAGEFWHQPFQSGKGSAAMMELIEQVRRLAQAEEDVRLFCFDSQPPDRERRLADNLVKARAEWPRATVIVLTGNVHSRTTKGVPWDADYEPMGLHLVRAGTRLTSLNLSSSGGTAWFCTGNTAAECGEKPSRAEADRGSEAFVELAAEPRTDGHHGIYYVGAVSASPPAVGIGR